MSRAAPALSLRLTAWLQSDGSSSPVTPASMAKPLIMPVVMTMIMIMPTAMLPVKLPIKLPIMCGNW